MPIDPNIALGVRQPEPVNMLGQMGQMMALRAAQQQYESENALRDFYAQGGDISTAEGRKKIMSASPKLGAELINKQSEMQARDVNTLEKRKALFDNQIKAATTPEHVAQITKAMYADPYVGQMLSQIRPLNESLAAIPNDPKGLEDFRRNMTLSADNLFTSANAQLQAKTTIDAAHIRNQPAYARLAAEQAAPTLTPESVDMAANVYLQTGQLPPMGIGKNAAAQKAAIINRATVLGGAGSTTDKNALIDTEGTNVEPSKNKLVPKTAEELARQIVTNKQDQRTNQSTLTSFSGQGINGRRVIALNTVADHSLTMGKLIDALENNDVKAVNALGNTIARQTGSPAPTNFDAAKKIFAQEVVKAIVANGGGVKEREEAAKDISSANSPEQLRGVINTYQELVAGQLGTLRQSYETTGRKDFDKFLTPAAKNLYAGKSGAEINTKTNAGAPGKNIVRTGTLNGRKVIQYSDGSIDYGD